MTLLRLCSELRQLSYRSFDLMLRHSGEVTPWFEKLQKTLFEFGIGVKVSVFGFIVRKELVFLKKASYLSNTTFFAV